MLKALIAAWMALAVISVSIPATQTVEAATPITMDDLCPT